MIKAISYTNDPGFPNQRGLTKIQAPAIQMFVDDNGGPAGAEAGGECIESGFAPKLCIKYQIGGWKIFELLDLPECN